ncbi:MAG: FtsH protease activity modulator HflK [Burkholderiaceae bacterium]|nr:FtsH protease activity modulator HflK [Burkholderiaceae bacterium]
MFVSLLKRIGLTLSINDPQWGRGSQNDNKDGKKPNEGPPEIEQMWRDLNQWLKRVLGGKGDQNGGGGGFNPDSTSAKIGVGMIIVIFLFIWLVSSFFTVKEGQTAVITTFGKYSYNTTPGFNWHWPYPIQEHEIVNLSEVRTVEVGYQTTVKNKIAKESLMLTDDENIIDIQFAVQFKLKNASDWIFKNRDKEELIKQVAETSIREIVGKNKMDFVLYEGREKVATDVNLLMQQILDRYESGAQITNVTMQAVQPPEQVQAAFDDAVKAGQDKERQKNEGQAYANDVIPKARGEASRLLQEAEGYRSRVVANAEGNAARFKQVLVEYQKAPAVTRDRIYLETMQQIFSSTSKVMIDTKNNSNLLYLPLDKLIQQSDATKTSEQNQQQSQQTVPSSVQQDTIPTVELKFNKDGRARDGRDREVR